jgi:ligand-binding sensor protein
MLKFDQEKLISLLTDFYRLTGIKICICDEEGREISYAPEHLCAFCGYIRSSAAGSAACAKSDEDAFAVCRKTGSAYVYTCHVGLTECVSPILQQGRLIGFIMLGQTVGSEERDFERIRPKIAAYALNEERAEGLYSLIKFSSEEKVRAAANLTEAIAGYLYLNKLIEAGENTGSKIGGYIRAHLDGDLSANALCRAFKISRVDLYACFKHTFSCTPAEYVKRARLDRSLELLATPLPITKIAQEIGICDYNYFSKIFKSSFGVSPRTYRNRLKK